LFFFFHPKETFIFMSQGKRNQGEQTATVVPVLPELLEGKDGLLHFDGKIENIRGHQLYYYSLFPSLNKKQVLRGIVFHLHGIGDHSRAYTHFYEELCAHQYGVIAYDMISHGASDNDIHDVRAHSVAFDHFVEDTNQFLTFAKSELLPKYGITCYQSNKNQDQEEKIPLIFTGMSYGTLVGIHTIVSQEHQFDGVILSAPVVSVEWTTSLKIQAAFSKWLSSMIPKARIVPGVNNDCKLFLTLSYTFLLSYTCQHFRAFTYTRSIGVNEE
jgi:acylglycerol lipase